MDERVPAPVRPLLEAYLAGLAADLPGLCAGVYLHGSIAYGGFMDGASDIDVLGVTTRICTPDDLDRLRRIHAALKEAWPAWKLEASYVPRAHLGPPRGVPAHPFHRDGVFAESGVFDFDSPLWAEILWWQVKTRGIALCGPPPSALGLQVTEADLLAASRRLVETYWPRWTRPGEELFRLRHALHVDWVVFGTLRTWYTLREHDVTTKPGAAAYGLAHLPPRWHRLIRQTVAQRAQPVPRGLLTRVRIGIDAALYLRYMLRECRRLGAGPARP